MPYIFEIEPPARQQIRAIPREVQQRVTTALSQLAEQPRPLNAKRLTGYDRTYRLRLGSYRIFYEIEDRIRVILVIEVGHRREVYDRFRRRGRR